MTDGNGGSDTIIVTVNVRDINTASPVFTEGDSSTRSIPENTGPNVNVGAPVTATDADGTTLSYTMRHLDLGFFDPDVFTIDSATGQIKTKLPLDFETKRSYRVSVTVWDGDHTLPLVRTDRIFININISNVNEAPIIKQGSSATFSVNENTAADTNIGSPFTASDEDGDDISWSLDGTDKDSFNIDENTGQVKTSDALDYETKRSYSMKVVASDGNNGTDSLDLTITLNDLFENPLLVNRTPHIAWKIISETGVSNEAEITEAHLAAIQRLLINRTSLSSLMEDDFDGLSGLTKLFLWNNELTSLPENIFDGLSNLELLDLSSNRLTSLPENIFDGLSNLDHLEIYGNELSSLSAEIFDGLSSLNYLDMSYIDVTSLPDGIFIGLTALETLDLNGNGVRDSEGNKDVHIPVRLVKDGTGVKVQIPIGAPYDVSVPVTITNGSLSDSATSITVSAGTVESSTVSVTRTVGTTEPVTANIGTFSSLPSGHSGYKFVNGLDSAVTIIPRNAANAAPIFTDGTETARTIAENTAADTNIGTPIAATDANSDTLTYTLTGTDAASFDIVSTTGQLKTEAALDFETKTLYTVTITVSDGNGGLDSITVTINVTDITVNNVPTFTDGANTTRSVEENTAAGTNIGTAVAATDADGDTLAYTLTGTDASSFSIVSTTGQLQTSVALDYETKTSYSVTIKVTAANEGGNASIDVTINVTNIVEDTLLVGRTPAVVKGILDKANLESADSMTAEILNALDGTLDLSEKSISSLKEGDFDGLSSVKRVDLDNNSLTSLPDNVFKGLTAVTYIVLSANRISSISEDAFDGLSTLEALRLSSNSLSSLDVNVFDGLSALKDLGLGENSLSSLDEDLFEDLTSLEILRLSYNELTTLPEDIFDGLTSLKELNLPKNELTSLPSGLFDGLSSLNKIYLYLNKLTSLPDGLLEGLTSLTRFWAEDNTTDPLKFTVNLVLDGSSVKVQIPIGVPKDVDIPITITNGSLSGDVTSIRVLKGSVESEAVAVIRTAGTTGAVTADIGTLPNLTSNKNIFDGIALSKASTGLPLTVFAAGAAPAHQTPNSTALLPNFPNPFNPETWIPYQLANPADVSLTIYNIRGVVVRQIALKQQPAGFYTTRSRALHWDGRNAVGEKVAGGVYFYHFKAGEYSALRKMLILK